MQSKTCFRGKKGFRTIIKVVFGCGGNRDKEGDGEIVSALSNSFIITNDNPRDEDKLIVQDILPGVINGADYQIELDRKSD